MDLYDSLGLLNSSIQFAGAQMGAVRDKKFIREENEKARQFQIDMWNRMNEYNMPSAVLQRYRDAGIEVNPNYLVTGKYDGGLASLASAPGHSAPNMNTAGNARYLDLASFVQLRNQNRLVESQISLNEMKEANLRADAEQKLSTIPSNLAQKDYIDALTQVQENQDIWFDISLPIRNELLNLEQAIKAGQADMVVEETKNLIQTRENNKTLTNLKVYATNQAVELAWKNYDLSKQELAGKLELWLKEGDAAVRNSKANFLNALCNGRLVSLKEKAFNKFSDVELDILDAKLRGLKKKNAWIDVLNEQAILKGNVNIELIQSKTAWQHLKNDNYYNEMIMDLGTELLDINN